MRPQDCTETTCCQTPEGSEQDTCEQAIREQAYLLWEQAGKPEGDGTDFWLEAEKRTTTQSCEEQEFPATC